ncbi:MAG: hypothetical protein GY868_21410, partial [Deltaproteobacteria bacterium]|nr:hypothetical protein [Deltaproteobacteria bacterium]
MLKSFCWITTACVLFLICFQTMFSAQAAAEATIETQAVIGGATRGCLIEGSRLYSLTGSRLAVIDISSQATPVELGSLALPGVGRRLAISDQVLYVACWKGGLIAVDVSAPATPKILSQLTFDSDAEQKICETFDVEISGSYAYIADQTSGFITVDISDPARPAVVSAFTEFENPRHRSYDICIDGAYAYVACELDGLYVFDISTPASPQL